jgi:cytochrome b pre-mRNA-processing protein 3
MPLLERLHRFLLRPAADPATAALYRACIEQGRQPVFYRSFGVPDSVDGRFDLLVLHVYLVIRRLADAAARQRLFDLMFADMDRSLREMGVGDMSIGKKIKPMLAGFYGRAKAYEEALKGGKDELAAALARNLCGSAEAMANGYRLADYVQRAIQALEAQAPEALARGEISFAAPVIAEAA